MADDPNATVEVVVRMPEPLHRSLEAFCKRFDLTVDDVVSRALRRWLLGQTLTLLQESEEVDREPSAEPMP